MNEYLDMSAINQEPVDMDRQTSLDACQTFLDEHSESVGALFGVRRFSISVGDEWETDLESGEVTADLRFFIDKGYTPEMSVYALCHEIAAHLRAVEYSPELMASTIYFLKTPRDDPQLREARSVFNNIFSDIAGNNLIHATLPDMKSIAKDLYSQKLSPDDDLTDCPRHLQFLYKIIREEMIEGSTSMVYPEVDSLISAFRDHRGAGDIIKYSTQVAKSRFEPMPEEEKFALWTKVIYPEWLKLYEADLVDPKFQNSPQKNSGGSPEGEGQGDSPSSVDTDENQSGDETPSTNEREDQEGSQVTSPDFSEYYKDYHENIHPDPINREDMDKIIKEVHRQKAKEANDKRRADDPSNQLAKKFREETGHSLSEKRRYDSEIIKWGPEIEALREVFKSILNDRISKIRHLSGNHTQGAILNPNTLAQTYIDIKSGVSKPPAYADYESHEAERTITGKTDYVFAIDCSSSMQGESAQMAASSMVMCLEALAGMQRDITQAEAQHNITSDLDIRTALLTFGGTTKIHKELSNGLTTTERLSAYGDIIGAQGNSTHNEGVIDYALSIVKTDPERNQILIVVTDGKAHDKDKTRAKIELLRKAGWKVYGISITSNAATQLYSPDARRIDSPAELPDTLRHLIESTL